MMLACITGTVDQELLLKNEYLAAENRILRAQSRLLLSDAEKATLAEIAHRLGRKALEHLATPKAGLRIFDCFPTNRKAGSSNPPGRTIKPNETKAI
jgi:hypothetical protein